MSKSFAEFVAGIWPGATCPHCKHYLNELRHSWIGNRNTVKEVDAAQFTKHLDGFVERFGTLDVELGDLVDDLSQTSAIQKEMLRGLFLIKGHTFHELSKSTPGTIEHDLTDAGIDNVVAKNVGLAIYKRRREVYFPSNEVEVLSPRSSAIKGLAEKDLAVTLRRCSLNYDDFPSFASAIVKNTFLCSLDLTGNNIHTLGAIQLSKILPELPHLHTLLLGGNAIQPKGVEEVCAALEGRRLKALDLSCNNGGPTMGTPIALVSVMNLNVSGNDIGAAGAVALTPAARRCINLNISSNGITDGAAIAQLLATCDVLANVDVSFNVVDTGMIELVGTLASHPAITSLKMEGVGVPDVGVKTLFTNRTQLQHLTYTTKTHPPSEAVKEGLLSNKLHLAEFKKALLMTPVASWSSEDVHNALVLLLGRRDIAVQIPVDGQQLVQLLGLDREEDWKVLCAFLDQFHT